MVNGDDYLDLVKYISLVFVLLQTKCNNMSCILNSTFKSCVNCNVLVSNIWDVRVGLDLAEVVRRLREDLELAVTESEQIDDPDKTHTSRALGNPPTHPTWARRSNHNPNFIYH